MYTACYLSLYQNSVKLFKHGKYYIPTTELYHPVKAFDKKWYIYEIYHKYLY